MRTTLNISYYCRNSKKDKKGLAPVEASLIICGQRKFVNLPFKCDPEEFNKKSHIENGYKTLDFCSL